MANNRLLWLKRISGSLTGMAYKDPIHNIAILKAGIVDNGLATLVTLYFIVFANLRSIFMLISAPLTFIFFLSFILPMPKKEAAQPGSSG